MWQRYRLDKEVEKIRKIYPETQIYFSLMPSLPGIKSSHLTCRDQYGDEQSNTCLVNPYVQKVIIDILIEVSNKLQPNGIIFDIVDIYGQSSKGEGKPVDVTCFCNHCKEGMVELKFDPSVFGQRISPFNLVLSGTDTGIHPLQVRFSELSPEQLVDLAIKEEFVKRDDEQTRNWAQTMLKYFSVRARVTSGAIGDLCHTIKSSFPNMRVGAIINATSFHWTSGTDLYALAGQVDEVWLDIEELSAQIAPPNIEIFAYAADRARYRIDAFFEFASDKRFLENRLMRGNIQELTALLYERMGQLNNVQNLNKTFVNSIRKMDYIAGFVGIPQDRKIYQQVVQSVITEMSNIADNIQQKPTVFSKDVVQKYIASLLQYREQGNELNRREILGLAGELGLIN